MATVYAVREPDTVQRISRAVKSWIAPENANSAHQRDVDGDVWYADKYLYPNHWHQGSGGAVLLPGCEQLLSRRQWLWHNASTILHWTLFAAVVMWIMISNFDWMSLPLSIARFSLPSSLAA